MKKTVLVLRAGLQETFLDKKIIVLLLIIGFIIDNGVRRMVDNALQAGQPLGIFEGFIMCVNHWYYLIIFLVGFIFVLAGVPRLDSEQIFLIYRIGKKSWFFGEILQVSFCAVIYILLLFLHSPVITPTQFHPHTLCLSPSGCPTCQASLQPQDS